jgi:hypothetical protein
MERVERSNGEGTRKLIVNELIRVGFAHGGWHLRYVDDLSQQRALEIFAAYWTNVGEEEQVVAEPLNTKPRYGASTTLPDPLEWQNLTRLQPDAAASRAGGR